MTLRKHRDIPAVILENNRVITIYPIKSRNLHEIMAHCSDTLLHNQVDLRTAGFNLENRGEECANQYCEPISGVTFLNLSDADGCLAHPPGRGRGVEEFQLFFRDLVWREIWPF